MLTPADALALARLYAEAESVALTTVGRRAAGYSKLFKRIAEGSSVETKTLLRLDVFFRENWPASAAWPRAILGPRTRNLARCA